MVIPGQWRRRINLAAALALLAATLWVSRYWYSAEFGFYEDDYTRLPQALAMDLPGLGERVSYALSHLTDHGKPLHSALIYTFAFIGSRLGGITGNYWVGFCLNLLGAWLFYGLLRRVTSPAFALIGGLAYCLFSADTTQAFLTHAMGLHPSLILLLLAFHAYLSGKKPSGYVLAALILLNYETPYPVFLAAPLLGFTPDRKWLRQAAVHALILGALLALVAGIRLLAGESRVTGLDARTALTLPLAHMLAGPYFCLKALLSKPYQAAQNLKPEMLAAALAAFPVYTAFFWLARTDPAIPDIWRGQLRAWWSGLRQDIQPLGRQAFLGLTLLALAYPLTFTVDVTIMDGRDSRVHLAAVIGAAWLTGCAGILILKLARAILHKLAGAAALAAYFSLLLAYGFLIQGNYALSWQQQRSFWTQLLPLVGDIGDGTVILVEPSVPGATGQIGVLTWNTPRVLEQIYTFPPDWRRPPRVYRLEPGWEAALGAGAGRFWIGAGTSFIAEDEFVHVESQQAIFIQTDAGRLVRRFAPLMLGGVEYPLKPLTEERLFDRQALYDWIILPK